MSSPRRLWSGRDRNSLLVLRELRTEIPRQSLCNCEFFEQLQPQHSSSAHRKKQKGQSRVQARCSAELLSFGAYVLDGCKQKKQSGRGVLLELPGSERYAS